MFISLIGNNIKKSFTPSIYDFLFKKTKKKIFFRGFLIIEKKNVYKRIILIFSKKYTLLNITIPYKELCFIFSNFSCLNSFFLSSINCIFLYKKCCLIGFNTDGIGFLKDFRKKIFVKKKPNILILGIGGAFKGIINFLKKISNGYIFLKNRNIVKEKKIINNCNLNLFKFKKKYKYNILINTIPTKFFIDFLLKHDLIRKKIVCYDIGYIKKIKKFSSYFTFFSNGYGMLVSQAIENFKIIKKINESL
ncbi:hypothetical protein ACWNX6_00665 [Candidatus Vidania fulgoroideorum]